MKDNYKRTKGLIEMFISHRKITDIAIIRLVPSHSWRLKCYSLQQSANTGDSFHKCVLNILKQSWLQVPQFFYVTNNLHTSPCVPWYYKNNIKNEHINIWRCTSMLLLQNTVLYTQNMDTISTDSSHFWKNGGEQLLHTRNSCILV